MSKVFVARDKLILTHSKKLLHLSFKQIFIGLCGIAISGVLLALKQDQKTNGSADSSKGLGLARAPLTTIDKLEPRTATNTTNKIFHTGLTVYNTTDDWDTRGLNTDSYLNAKAVVGGATVLDDASLSVHRNAVVDGNTAIVFGTKPALAAILDLKTEAIAPNSTILVISPKSGGLLLPRVKLESTHISTSIYRRYKFDRCVKGTKTSKFRPKHILKGTTRNTNYTAFYKSYCKGTAATTNQKFRSDIAEVAVGFGAKNNLREWMSFMCFNLRAKNDIMIKVINLNLTR